MKKWLYLTISMVVIGLKSLSLPSFVFPQSHISGSWWPKLIAHISWLFPQLSQHGVLSCLLCLPPENAKTHVRDLDPELQMKDVQETFKNGYRAQFLTGVWQTSWSSSLFTFLVSFISKALPNVFTRILLALLMSAKPNHRAIYTPHQLSAL